MYVSPASIKAFLAIEAQIYQAGDALDDSIGIRGFPSLAARLVMMLVRWYPEGHL